MKRGRIRSPARRLGSAYTLHERIGRGAMGEVWRAVDRRTGESVAAKLLHEKYAEDAQIVGRFVQERAILLALRHPNIVRVRDLVAEGSDLAIVMDLVDGADLRGHLRRHGELPVDQAVGIVALVLDGLAEAHAHGVLHRDVKPDNVLVRADPRTGAVLDVLLSDFSIARLVEETAVRASGSLGTAEYMAPEVVTDETSSPAADVYGAGVLLYELLNGRTPFAGKGNAIAVAHRALSVDPTPLTGVPQELNDVIMRMLRKRPGERPSAAQAATALRDLALPAAAGGRRLPQQLGPAVPGHPSAEPPRTAEGVTQVRTTRDPVKHRPVARRSPPPRDVPHVAELDLDGPLTQIHPHRTSPAREGSGGPPVVRLLNRSADRFNDWWNPLSSNRRRQVIGGSGAVVLLVVAGLILLLSRAGDDAAPQFAVRGAAEVSSGPSATGLTVERSAVFNPRSKSTMTTVTWSADDVALTGPMLESVPASQPGMPCPAVYWYQGRAESETALGVSAEACAWRVDTGVIPAHKSFSASWVSREALPAAQSPTQALSVWLRKANSATQDTLAEFGTQAVYPVQRLQELSVSTDGVIRLGGPVSLRVEPIWLGSSRPDEINTVFTTDDGENESLVKHVGKLTFSTTDCTGAIALEEGVPFAKTAAPNCTVTVELGQLTADSDPFSVLQNSGG